MVKNLLMVCQPLHNRGDESAHKGLLRKLISDNPSLNIKVLFINEDQNTVDQYKVDGVEYINVIGSKYYIRFSRFIAMNHTYYLTMLMKTMRIICKYIKESDAVLCAPGGINLGGFRTWNYVFLFNLVKKFNKPLFFYGRSIGPFSEDSKLDRQFKQECIDLFDYMSYISLRDKKSEKVACQLGIQKFISTIDSAFLDSPKVNIPTDIKEAIGNSPYIVFVPNILIWHFVYKNRIQLSTVHEFYSHIVEIITKTYPEHKIIMLPQTFNYRNEIRDDIHLFRDIQKQNSNAPIVVINDQLSSDVQQTIISNAKMMIGARYHSIVFAINQCVPFVALSYEHKISGLLETLELENRMIDIVHALDNQHNMLSSLKEFECILHKPCELLQPNMIAKQKVIETFNALIPLLNH